MRILNANEISELYNNSITIYKYFALCGDLVTEKEINDYNKFFDSRKNKPVDEIFKKIFYNYSTDTEEILHKNQGIYAEIGGYEYKGINILLMNCEMGLSYYIVNPEIENYNKYMEVISIINEAFFNDDIQKYLKTVFYTQINENTDKKTSTIKLKNKI